VSKRWRLSAVLSSLRWILPLPDKALSPSTNASCGRASSRSTIQIDSWKNNGGGGLLPKGD
jgi:hypothetical protein